MFHLFPKNHRSVDDMLHLHNEMKHGLFDVIQANPLSPQALASYSLIQLHHLNYNLKLLTHIFTDM
eukprot:UN08485